jgi:tetratricopeptide (TPR) repeat protein
MKQSSRTVRMVWGLALVALLTALWLFRERGDDWSALLPAEPNEAGLPQAWRDRVRAARTAVAEGSGPEAIRELARLYHANHRDAEAARCYDLLLTRVRDITPQDRYLRADLALRRGDLARAQSELRNVLEKAPDYVPAQLALGLAQLKSGQTEAAAAQFTEILAENPQHIEASVTLARLEMQRSDESAARARLEQLVAARPEATSAVTLLAQWVERQGEVERAQKLRELSRQRPEPAMPDPWKEVLDDYVYDHALLGLHFEELAQSGEGERAARFLRRIEELAPGSAVPHLLQGAVAARERRHRDAVEHLQAALARGGDVETIAPALTTALLALGQTETAQTLLQRYLAERPESVPLQVAYSEVFVKEKNRPSAREVLSRALEYQPYLVPQNMALAEILWAGGEYDAAAHYLRRVAQIDVKHFAARALLGEHHLRRGDSSAALAVLEQAQTLAPDEAEVRASFAGLHASAHLQAGQTAVAEGSAEQALAHFDHAAAIAPGEPQAQAGRAQVLMQLGDYGRAADALQKLAELQPENPTILLSLGDVRLRQGRTDLAVQHWTAARRLVAPGDERLRAALDHRLGSAASSEAQP